MINFEFKSETAVIKKLEGNSMDLQYLLSGLREDLLHLLFMRLLQSGDGRLVLVVFRVQCIDNLQQRGRKSFSYCINAGGTSAVLCWKCFTQK